MTIATKYRKSKNILLKKAQGNVFVFFLTKMHKKSAQTVHNQNLEGV